MAFEFQVPEELRAMGVSQIQGLWVTKLLFPQDCLFLKYAFVPCLEELCASMLS